MTRRIYMRTNWRPLFSGDDVLPLQFLAIYLLTKKLVGEFDQAILPMQVGELPLYVVQTIVTVQLGASVFFPLVSSTERVSAYGKYKKQNALGACDGSCGFPQ